MPKSNIHKSTKFWDRVSGWNKAETAVDSTLIRAVNDASGTYILPGDTVLDYGCGTGMITLGMAHSVNRIYGVDISQGMLRRAEQNTKDQQVGNAVFSRLTTLEELFTDDFFQLITTFNVLQYVENRKKLFSQFYKLLKPQGRLIVAVPCFGSTNSFTAFLVKFLRFVHIMPDTFFFSVDQIENEITAAGFTLIESVSLSNLPEKFIVAQKV